VNAGELPNLTGVSDPYEPPLDPDVEVHTDRESVAFCTAKIMAALNRLELG
jgi:adenylylsulfate kinase